MKIFTVFKNGLKGSLGSWKGVLIIWLVSFVFLELVKVPLRGVLNTGLGYSMATERLADGVDLEILADLGAPQLGNLVFSLVRSTAMAWLFAFLINIFFSGGIFDYLKDLSEEFSCSAFFSASAINFKSFFIVKLLSGLIMSALFCFIYLFVALFNLSGSVVIKIIVIALALIMFILLLQILAVADYARARKASDTALKGTKALGFGFKTAFSNILPSLAVIVPVTVLQLIAVMIVLQGIIRWVPQSGFFVFMLFVATQLLYLINVFFKVWRFGAITDLMRQIHVTDVDRQKNVIQEPGITDDIAE